MKRCAILLFSALVSASALSAQTPGGQSGQTGAAPGAQPASTGANLVVILDVSTSMRHEFEEMRAYLRDSIIGKAVKDGDWLCIYTFGVRVDKAFEGAVATAADRARALAVVDAIKPIEKGTDIGLMLEQLDALLKAAKLPKPRTTIFWVTDGKNDPAWGSKYYGKDVYDPKAFDAYTIVKSAAYKVLLLSIGDDTAAQDLGGPLGGSVVEAKPGATAEELDALLGDVRGAIEFVVPESLGRASARSLSVPLGFKSTYADARNVVIERLTTAIDGGSPVALFVAEPKLSVKGNDTAYASVTVELPDALENGEHALRFELATENNQVSFPSRVAKFEYRKAVNPLVVLGIAGGVALLGAAVFFILAFWRRKKREDEERAETARRKAEEDKPKDLY